MNQSANPLISLLPLVLIFGIFYFMLIRPMQKKQKLHGVFLNNLKKGDKVITTGGLYGSILAVEDDCLILELAENVKVRVAKNAVSGPQPGEGKDDVA